MTTTEKESKQEKRPIDIARENLKLLSLEVKDLVEDGTFFTINDAIMETLYKDEANKEFKSYRQWKKDGYQVNKGEKAYLLWAKPKQIQKPIEEGKSNEDLDEMLKYFPIAYLFSNAQVDSIEEEAEQEPSEEPKPQESKPTRWQPLEY